MEDAERYQPLRASERPLRATGSGQKAASGEPGSTDPGAGERQSTGSGEVNRPALLSAVLNAVHAGSEPGWKSGHLEPFFCGTCLPRDSPNFGLVTTVWSRLFRILFGINDLRFAS